MNYLIDNPAGKNKRFNVGDDIQTVAAAQFISTIDGLIYKENISGYSGPACNAILNGWFMHHPENWPPAEQINPLLTSMHFTPSAAEIMLKGKGLEYMKRYGPIGCRDINTLDILTSYGIESFLSGCLTLTLERSQFVPEDSKREGILIVDLLYKLDDEFRRSHWRNKLVHKILGSPQKNQKLRDLIIEKILGKEKNFNIKQFHHSLPIGLDDHANRWGVATSLLKSYANAELVITSRIHCALPCLAFGTPVIFVDSALDNIAERARLESLLKLFNVVRFDINSSEFEMPFNILSNNKIIITNKLDYLPYRKSLIEQVQNFYI